MAPSSPVLFALIALALAGLVGGLTYLGLSRPHLRIAERARAVAADQFGRGDGGGARRGALLLALAHPLFRAVGRLPLIEAAQRERFAALLRTAGWRHPQALSWFIAVKVLAGAGLAAAGLAVATLAAPPGSSPLLAAALTLGGLVGGLILPEAALRWAVARRQRQVLAGVPDALDLMVICTNAGFSLGATLRRVATEFADLNPALANELAITADDIAVRADPLSGLRNLSARMEIPALTAMVTTLVQAQRYGTPITQSLRTLAQTERRARILAMEEKGAKLSTKITIPMMTLILPAVLILAAGPAVLRIMEAFAK
ncbi:type II secretion system F family protein [Phaeospirillum tilakii]|uniref:Type II secretion system F family protein n=1 Tax=Phaeospirillum tilakii TaxID=741673 RepID=A0ABW5CEX2_9PROT